MEDTNIRWTFEVGGENKSYDQIADLPNSYILADDIEMPHSNKIPFGWWGSYTDCCVLEVHYGVEMVACLRHAGRVDKKPHTKRPQGVQCGVNRIACRRHAHRQRNNLHTFTIFR